MMEKGTTFDILVAETAVGYENYLNKKDRGDGIQSPTPELSQEKMQAMIDKVKANEAKSR
jgi:hypothetical protein